MSAATEMGAPKWPRVDLRARRRNHNLMVATRAASTASATLVLAAIRLTCCIAPSPLGCEEIVRDWAMPAMFWQHGMSASDALDLSASSMTRSLSLPQPCRETMSVDGPLSPGRRSPRSPSAKRCLDRSQGKSPRKASVSWQALGGLTCGIQGEGVLGSWGLLVSCGRPPLRRSGSSVSVWGIWGLGFLGFMAHGSPCRRTGRLA